MSLQSSEDGALSDLNLLSDLPMADALFCQPDHFASGGVAERPRSGWTVLGAHPFRDGLSAAANTFGGSLMREAVFEHEGDSPLTSPSRECASRHTAKTSG